MMSYIYHFLILISLFSGVSPFLLDQDNYFYLNTSYTRQTISISMCFKLNATANISLASDVIIPQKRTSGTIQNFKAITFEPPFDSQIVDYNSYDDSEYWFGAKIRYPNEKHHHFITLEMNLTQNQRTIPFVFLLPLFKFPLSALPVSPNNSLTLCQNELLVSVIYRENQFDVTVMGAKGKDTFMIVQGHDWKYFNSDVAVDYLRYKSKKTSVVTVKGKLNERAFVCKYSPSFVLTFPGFAGDKVGYNLSQLISLSSPEEL